MKVTLEQTAYIAELARLSFDDDELRRRQDDLNRILEYVEKLDELQPDDVEPLSHPVENTGRPRADVVASSLPIEDTLRNAPDADDRHFKTPKAISV
ncbi:MAG: Asp-tRNA(Asn)/Glu-tRNA(Gln) amidotransferase subunit GatC [Ignavibacteriales bacterium]|jgi:aspartyl-tRNA(Asn)/glutamyl-tRNA(Gln) amidotransferase subunit C|nr:Asp-tRNA(Asn)/Glu-tRNA(Gln) amidotransferase subunit GatC [Ignavibacteriales bacterium]